jgi:hypothetical protein
MFFIANVRRYEYKRLFANNNIQMCHFAIKTANCYCCSACFRSPTATSYDGGGLRGALMEPLLLITDTLPSTD